MSGHVLIVEHLDRLSRQGHDEVLPLLTKLTQNGVTVATVDSDRVYPAFERVPLGPVIEAVVKSELAREESEKKSKRLAEAWQRKQDTAHATSGSHIAITVTVPAWINVDPKTKRMTLNEDRVRVLREIFQLTIDGYGTPAIARKLNERGEPVWKHRNIKSKNGWTVGYLTKIVLNRAVLGEYQPTKKPRGSGNGEARGAPVINYYPQAIDPITFAKAAKARKDRTGTSGGWQLTHGNLLSGIAKCAECGGRMFQKATVRKGQMRRATKGQRLRYAAKQDITYLGCFNAWNRVTDESTGKLRCTQREKVRYEPLERSLVHAVAGYAAKSSNDADPENIRKLEIELADARRLREGRQQHADNLARSFAESGSPMMERLALEAEAGVAEHIKRIAALEKKLDAERSQLGDGEPDEQAWFRAINELKASIYSDDDETRKAARVKMKQFLRRFLSSVVIDGNKETHVAIGDDAMFLRFDANGQQAGWALGPNAQIEGPNGEPDWHPDDEDREPTAEEMEEFYAEYPHLRQQAS